jgi:hypothetical protein
MPDKFDHHQLRHGCLGTPDIPLAPFQVLFSAAINVDVDVSVANTRTQ